jgi:PAS domain S-box-containing protein
MIFLKDAEGRYLLANREFERLFGITNEALAGKRPEDILPPDLAESSSAQDLEVLRTGRPSTKEETFVIDGRERTVLTSKFPVLDDADELIGIGTVATDITERKQAEQEAERSRVLLASAVEALDEGFVIFDDDDRMVLCNSTYRDIYRPAGEGWEPGVSLEEVARDTARHCVGLEDEGEVEALVRRRLEQHHKLGVPFEQELRDGRWIRAGEYPLPNGWTVGTRSDITGLKRTEEELRASQARLIDAIESISEAFVLFDADERLVLCNSKYREIFAEIADHIVPGAGLEDLLRVAAERGQIAEAVGNVEEWVENRLHLYRSDHEPLEQQLDNGRWMLTTDHRTRDGGIVGIRTDITEIKRTEAALRESEARLATALKQAKLAYWSYRFAEREISDWSEEAANILGIAAKDLPKSLESYLGLVHPEDRGHVAGIYEVADSANPKHEGYQIEYRIPRPDGGIAWLQESSEVEYGADGAPVGYLGTIQDITALKKAEAALRESEERFRSVVDNSPAAIFLKDLAGRYRLVNRQFEQWYGCSASDVIGKTSHEVFPEHLADQYAAADREVMKTGRPSETEFEVSLLVAKPVWCRRRNSWFSVQLASPWASGRSTPTSLRAKRPRRP